MQRVTVAELSPGVTLAKPVLDSHGRILLSSGTALTASTISCLERWGIASVEVDDSMEVDHQSQGTEGWDQLFADHRDNSEMELIRSALEQWSARRAEQQEDLPS